MLTRCAFKGDEKCRVIDRHAVVLSSYDDNNDDDNYRAVFGCPAPFAADRNNQITQ